MDTRQRQELNSGLHFLLQSEPKENFHHFRKGKTVSKRNRTRQQKIYRVVFPIPLKEWPFGNVKY